MSRGNQTRTKKPGANKNRRVTTGTPQSGQEQSRKPIITGPSGQANYARILAHKMDEFRRGRLYNASAERVSRPNQVLNIARHEPEWPVLATCRWKAGRKKPSTTTVIRFRSAMLPETLDGIAA